MNITQPIQNCYLRVRALWRRLDLLFIGLVEKILKNTKKKMWSSLAVTLANHSLVDTILQKNFFNKNWFTMKHNSCWPAKTKAWSTTKACRINNAIIFIRRDELNKITNVADFRKANTCKPSLEFTGIVESTLLSNWKSLWRC